MTKQTETEQAIRELIKAIDRALANDRQPVAKGRVLSFPKDRIRK